MNTPLDRGVGPLDGTGQEATDGDSYRWTWADCLVGLVATGAAFLFYLPELTAVARPFGVLSTTAITFLFLFAWLCVWALVSGTRNRLPPLRP